MIDGLVGLGYGLIVLAILIGVGLVILQNFQGATVSKLLSASVANETYTTSRPAWVNSTGYTLATASTSDFVPTISVIINATDGKALQTGNYTVSAAGIVTNATVTSWNYANISYTYTYSANTTASSTTGTLMNYLGSGSGGLVTWVPAIIALVIGMYFIGAFAGSKGRKV